MPISITTFANNDDTRYSTSFIDRLLFASDVCTSAFLSILRMVLLDPESREFPESSRKSASKCTTKYVRERVPGNLQSRFLRYWYGTGTT